MNSPSDVVGMFPGQGAYRQAVFARCWHTGVPEVREVYEAVDSAAQRVLGRAVTPVVFASEPPTASELLAADPDALQLAIFAQSVSSYRLLRRNGAELSCLLGHSMGEIAALVSAGAFSLDDGAEILCHRIAALRANDTSGGRMLAIEADAERVRSVLALVGNSDTVLAVENGPGQVVVSGPPEGITAVGTIAGALGLTSVRLKAPHPFHNPLLAEAARAFEDAIASYEQCRMSVPVYSPILGRRYRDGDRLPALLARHLVLPVDFGSALASLLRDGERTFVEFGPGATLGRITERCAPVATVLDAFHGLDEQAAALEVAAYLDSVPQPPEAPAAQTAPLGAVPEQRSTRERRPEQPQAEPVSTEPNAGAEQPAVEPEVEAAEPGPAGAELFEELRSFYAQALEYPEEVLTEDAVFERDLGVDSVQQTELLTSLRAKYRLEDTATVRPGEYDTLGKVAEYVRRNRAGLVARAQA